MRGRSSLPGSRQSVGRSAAPAGGSHPITGTTYFLAPTNINHQGGKWVAALPKVRGAALSRCQCTDTDCALAPALRLHALTHTHSHTTTSRLFVFYFRTRGSTQRFARACLPKRRRALCSFAVRACLHPLFALSFRVKVTTMTRGERAGSLDRCG
jgi:hypothetical protein